MRRHLLACLLLALTPLSSCDRKGALGSNPVPPPAQQKPDPLAAAVDLLAQNGVTAKAKDGCLAISAGFPFSKSIRRTDVIRINEVEGIIFHASEDFAVPTDFHGQVLMVSGGSFFASCNSTGDNPTLADACGNTWIFTKPSLSFVVTSELKKSFLLTTNVEGAQINFSDDGVLLKGFDVSTLSPKAATAPSSH